MPTSHKKAQSLVELLLAIGLFSIIIGSTVTLVIDSQKTNIRTLLKNKAIAYAEEGLEATRSIRDRNFLLLSEDLDGTGLTTANGYYELQGNSETLENTFTRQIFLENVYRDINTNIVQSGGTLDPNTIKVRVLVSWNNDSIELTSYLSNWQGSDYIETTQTEFNQGTFNQTAVSNSSEPPVDNGQVKLILTESDSGFFSSANLGNHGENVYVLGNYAYIAVNRSSRGFHIADVSNIENPVALSYVDIGDDGIAVEVVGNYAYVTSDNDSKSFNVVNVTNPNSPSVVKQISISGDDGHELEIRGNYAYIANDKDSLGFTVVDITDPLNPFVAATLNITEEGSDIVVSGNYAYVAVKNNSSPLAIVNISNPTAPSLVRTFDSGPHSDGGIDLNGNYLYLAGDGNPDLAIIDISNPSTPVLVSSLEFTNNSAVDLSHKDNIVYMAFNDENNGIAAIDVSNPQSPRLLYQLDVNGKGTGTFATTDNVFITTGTNNSGLVIIETTQQGFGGSGDFTSRIFDSGSSQTTWRSFSWESTNVPGGSLTFQVKTASSSGGISSATWVGPDGTTNTFYNTSPSTIILDPNRSGTQFIQYKAFFTSDGNSTPVLEKITLNYVN